jgi:hypothetical protein
MPYTDLGAGRFRKVSCTLNKVKVYDTNLKKKASLGNILPGTGVT